MFLKTMTNHLKIHPEQEQIIEANQILVFVPDEDGSLKPMYLDKRILSGELKL